MILRFVAIDPGAHGAVAWTYLDCDGVTVHVAVERFANMGECDLAGALDMALGCRTPPWGSYSVRAVIERVHAIPGVGSTTSSFAFGRSYGFVRGVLAARGVSYLDVPPGVWQAGLGLPKKLQGPARKRALRDIAKQRHPLLFPTLDTCDALLILDWAMHQDRETRGTA